jgi:hypothetical protein
MSTASLAATSYRVACTDNQLKVDPACNCKNTNSCFDQFLGNQPVGAELGIGITNGAPLSEMRALSRGELSGGSIAGYAPGGASLAIAKRGMEQLAGQLKLNGNPVNAEFAKGLMDKGIPASIAQLMAQQNVSKSALDSATAKFQGASAFQNLNITRSNQLNFGGGEGLGTSGNKNSNKKNDDFLAKLNPNNKAASSAKVMEFAAKAQAQGQIFKAETPLFEIISHRYQQSGRKLLEIDPAQ